MSIKVGDRVKIQGRSILGRVIEDFHDIPGVNGFIVRKDDGTKIKVTEDQLTLIDENQGEPNPDTITITREEFAKIVAEVSNPVNFIDKVGFDSAVAIGMSGALVCKRLEKELFGEKQKND